MAASRSGVPVYADTAALSRLGRLLRRAAPAASAAFRAAIRAGAVVVLEDAQARASFSTRIPQSGHVRLTRKGAAVVFTAPDAAPIENRGRGFVRHPVFGNRQNWTSKHSHPAFGAPALDARRAQVAAMAEKAAADATATVIDGGLR